MPYPDYGTPGRPGTDPYYVSPRWERRAEAISADALDDLDRYTDAWIGFSRVVRLLKTDITICGGGNRDDLLGLLIDISPALRADVIERAQDAARDEEGHS